LSRPSNNSYVMVRSGSSSAFARQLLSDEIALRRQDLSAKTRLDDTIDVFGDRWFALHQPPKIRSVEDEQICARHRHSRRRSSRISKGCNFTEKLARTKCNPFMFELDLHLPGRNEVHRMRYITT